jgi:hypothetical protein
MRRLPGVPPSKAWLSSVKTHLGIEEDHPNVMRVLEILRKKEAEGEISIEEHKEFIVLNDELHSAHQFLHGSRIYPTGELVSYPRMPTREQLVAVADWLFDADENEANATTERITALEQQVLAQGNRLFREWDQRKRWVQLAQAVGMDENHPALPKVLEGFDKVSERRFEEITWKESQAAMNALLGAMEEAWKKKNSH